MVKKFLDIVIDVLVYSILFLIFLNLRIMKSDIHELQQQVQELQEVINEN